MDEPAYTLCSRCSNSGLEKNPYDGMKTIKVGVAEGDFRMTADPPLDAADKERWDSIFAAGMVMAKALRGEYVVGMVVGGPPTAGELSS